MDTNGYSEITKVDQVEIGDEVVFIKNRRLYSIGKNNPLVGTKYETAGKVIAINNGGGYMTVKWDNGSENVYYIDDLLYKPAAGCVSIW